MAQSWRYVHNGVVLGPVTTPDLRLLADKETLKPTDMVCKEGSDKWVTAGSVRGLFYSGARGRSSWFGATCLILLAVVGLLAAGGIFAIYYFVHVASDAVASSIPHGPIDPGSSVPDGSSADKGASDKGASDKGASDKGALDKGASDKGASDKDLSDKDASDKDAPDKGPLGGGSRTYWKSRKGYFKHTSGDQWEEVYEGDTYHYMKIAQTPKYIELFDGSRNWTVRLYADHYDVKVNNRFERRIDGKWELPL